MCYFILLIAEADADVHKMREIAAPYGLQLPAFVNTSLARQTQGSHALFANRYNCDCGTPLGDAWRLADEPTDAQKQQHEIQKLKRKGWSDARIKRWKQDRQVVAKRENRLQHDREKKHETTLGLDEWKSLLTDLIEAVGGTTLLLHMFSGSASDEDIHIQERRIVHGPGRITDGLLLNVVEDVLYHFTAN